MSIQSDIITATGVRPDIDPQEEIRGRIDFLKENMRRTGRMGYVLGISGGQDSSLAGRLTQLAVEELRAEGYDATFTAMRLPYGVQRDEDDAQLALDFIRPDTILTHNIKAAVDAHVATYNAMGSGADLPDYDKGNVKARERMIAQYSYASHRKLCVVGTENSVEYMTGFFTIGGDSQADFNPVARLNKRQGKQLLAALGAPERLYQKAPTADLLDGKPGQTDEAELGFSYDDADDYLEGKAVPEPARSVIENRIAVSAFKRNGIVNY